MRTIKAAVCRNFGQPMAIEQVHLAAPKAREVQVDIEACAICHSDIAFADGLWGGSLPAIYGHEGVGRIAALGEGVEGYALGQRVLVTLLHACGGCTPCASGAPVYCGGKPAESDGPLTLMDGGGIVQGMHCGAFAESCTIHQSQIAAIPESIPPEQACLLSCGVITGIGAVVNTGRVRPGQTVVVIGAGGVGLNAIQGARLAGAARIVAVDLSEEKLTDAKEFGGTDGLLAGSDAPWEALRAVAPGMADAVIVTAGAISAIETAVNYLAPQGKIVLVGLPKVGAMASYDPLSLAVAGQVIVGSKMGDVVLARDMPWIIDLVQQGRLELSALISGRWRLDQINEAFADTRSGAARRNVIIF